jgi:PAP2 superfamily
VLSKGVSQHSARSADESESALFWNILTHLPFNDLALRLSAERKLSVHDNARLFALLHAVGADSQIASWHWKYHFDAWRPITAIRASAQPDWLSLIYSPSHPEYPSGHAAYGGAVVEVLKHVFGDKPANLVMTNPWSTMTRRYRNFDHIAQEIIDARVWAGVHFRSTDVQSNEMGRQIAAFALSRWIGPRAVNQSP